MPGHYTPSSAKPDRIKAVNPAGEQLVHPDGTDAYTDEIGPKTPKLNTRKKHLNRPVPHEQRVND